MSVDGGVCPQRVRNAPARGASFCTLIKKGLLWWGHMQSSKSYTLHDLGGILARLAWGT